MGTNWIDAEVMKLIKLWGEQGIQEQLEGSRRNKHVYTKLSSELAKHGIEKSGEQCMCKVKTLHQEYTKLKTATTCLEEGGSTGSFMTRLMKSGGAGLQLAPLWSLTQQMIVLWLRKNRMSFLMEMRTFWLETENSVENLEEGNACTSADVESSTEPSCSRSTTPAKCTLGWPSSTGFGYPYRCRSLLFSLHLSNLNQIDPVWTGALV